MTAEGTPAEPRPGARRRARRVVLSSAAALLVVATGVIAATSVATRAPGASPPTRHPSAVPASTPTPAASTPTLPQPQDSPTDPYASVPVTQLGTIEIPKIGLSSPFYEGVWLTVLDVGPGHWPGTALPGGFGNAVVAGHRVSHSHPFRRIDELGVGDTIVLDDATGRYTYSVTGSEVVTPDQIDVVTQRPGHTLTLFACHPPGSAAYRLVVHAQLVSAPRPGQ